MALTVEDDGVPGGVDPAFPDPASTAHAGAHGLLGMHERARARGGTVAVSRSTRGGWQVRALLLSTAR